MAKYATRQSANNAKGPNQRVVQAGKGFKLVATNSLAGRASTTSTGVQKPRVAANSGKGGGGKPVRASAASSGKGGRNKPIKPISANSGKGTGSSGFNAGNTAQKAVRKVKQTAQSTTNNARITAKSLPAKARKLYEKVDTAAERRAIIQKFKRKATSAVLGKDVGGRQVKRKGGLVGKAKELYAAVDTSAERKNLFQKARRRVTSAVLGKDVGDRQVKRTGGAVGAVKAWGSAAQKAAIRKLADFNRGKKRAGKAVTRKAVKYGLRSGARYGGNSGK